MLCVSKSAERFIVQLPPRPSSRLIFLSLLILLIVAGSILWLIIITRQPIPIATIPTLPPTTTTPTPGFTPATAFGQPVDMTGSKHITIDIVDSAESATCHPACFAIRNVKVKVGTIITWVNKSKTFHSITALMGTSLASLEPAPQIFDSGAANFINPGQSFSFTVDMAAYTFHPDHTVVYFCRVHPSMGAELTIVL
jgi:plastocyanin